MESKFRVAAADDIADGDVTQVQVADTKIALVRCGDDYFAIGDRCSHANYSLSEGDLDCEEMTLSCWKHGAEFSLADGVPQTLPAIKPVPVFDVEITAGEVFVSLPGEDA